MTKTEVFIIAFTAMALIVDFCLYAFEGEKATISYTILTDSRKLLLIPLLFGILTGHFFWSQC